MSMQQTIDETNRRRCKQMAYNKAHHLVPRPIVKPIESNELVEMQRQRMAAKEGNISPVAMKVSSYNTTYYAANGETAIAAEPSATYGKANEETIEQKKVRVPWLVQRQYRLQIHKARHRQHHADCKMGKELRIH